MSNIDQEMWQDFVVEAEENIQELEPNILLLEQDPSNASLLNDCFRNMHSIKGAANYMGLENIASLSHRMETLFDRVRQGDISLNDNAFNVLFDGIDRIKLLVSEVSRDHREQSNASDVLAVIDALLSGRDVPDSGREHVEDSGLSVEDDKEPGPDSESDDAELLAIFVEELQNRLNQLEQSAINAPVDVQVVLDMFHDMIRITNYIGREDLLAALEKEAEALSPSGPDADAVLHAEDIEAAVKRLSTLFTRYIGVDFSSSVESAGDIGLAGEEDEELYRIFLEFVTEKGKPLANIPAQPDSQWLEACRIAVEKLKISAYYMDYHDVVALLEEWDERLVEALSTVTEDQPFNGEPLRRLWARFCAMLPGLENYVNMGEQSLPDDGSHADTGINALESGEPDGLDAVDNMFQGVIPETEDEGDTEDESDAEDAGARSSDTKDDSWSGDGTFQGLESALDSMLQEQDGEPVAGAVAAPASAGVSSSDTAASAGGLSGSSMSLSSRRTRPPEGQVREAAATVSKMVRIDLAKVERLLEDVGELVVLRATMLQIADDMKALYGSWLDDRRLSTLELKPMKQIMIRTAEQTSVLEKVVHQLQDGIMRMRMLPVGTLFNRYPRIIRDLSRKLDKKVELVVHGEGTALDKRVIEHITDPLQHIVRNAVDHAIEPPDVREKQGKASHGTITLSAGQEGNFVVINIADDGRGLDREAIIQKAVSNGIINGETARTMSDERVWNMIFLPGISTASAVSETSGRGVGMDVVKNNIESLGGQITVTSSPGRGTSITMRIPLTLAIIQTLLVRVGEQNMAIPLSAVQETFRIYDHEVSSVEGFEIISLRQETLPLIRLGSIFRGVGTGADSKKLFVVRVRMQDMEAGLAVDSFVGQQEVVIKPLADYLTDQPGFSGATILGDGTVALILDIPAVLERARNFTLKRQQLMEQTALGLGQDAGMILH